MVFWSFWDVLMVLKDFGKVLEGFQKVFVGEFVERSVWRVLIVFWGVLEKNGKKYYDYYVCFEVNRIFFLESFGGRCCGILEMFWEKEEGFAESKSEKVCRLLEVGFVLGKKTAESERFGRFWWYFDGAFQVF